MQRVKHVFIMATVLAFAAYVLPSHANEPDEKRPPITLKIARRACCAA